MPKPDTPPSDDPKLKALTDVISAIARLEKRTDQGDVLRAAAQFHGFKVSIENGEIR